MTVLVGADGPEEIHLPEIRPEDIHKTELAVSTLPRQEIAEADLSRGTDDKVRAALGQMGGI